MRGRFIAVMLSTWRPSTVVHRSITEAASESGIDAVHVWGYNPTNFGTTHTLTQTLYHEALDNNKYKSTTDYLSNGNKFSGTNDVQRIRWQARLALDMWIVMSEARDMFPDDTLLYLENDAILIRGRIEEARNEVERGRVGAAACYRANNQRVYEGWGNLCFILTPRVNPAPHLLAYHLVQPADWIMSDFSRGKWPVYNCVSHGIAGKAHMSTRKFANETKKKMMTGRKS
jgi:hypothetical protein